VIGTSCFGTAESAFPVYDAFFAAGGRFFDTAWQYGAAYGAGCCEKALGCWLVSRGIRDQVVILGKGAHPPYCSPDAIEWQLEESLDRLEIERIDLYMLHRDNHDVPVAEFVDALWEQADRGLLASYGFSNWSVERVAEATRYAALCQRPPPAALSNHLSLATMVRPIYPGCLSASDAPSRAWLRETGMALIPWASQGRGVFVQRTGPSDLRSSSLAECWFSDENVLRVERATKLAVMRGVLPINIALAWVLHQPFLTFPIIGPRTVMELATSLPALDVELSSEEVAWLNLEEHETLPNLEEPETLPCATG
jgi:aryl-alcohol dehydrogenase-like predicted oxidoreductase